MKRRTLLAAGAAGMVSMAAACSSTDSPAASSSSSADGTYSLTFDKDTFTEKTATISTAAGDKEITYRLYSTIPYVAKPVDVDYQSLSVAVPVRIDGTEVDASGAPILFEIPVGGYMSAKTAEDPLVRTAGFPGGGMPGGGAPGGAGMPSGTPGGAGMPSGAPGGGAPGGNTGNGGALATGMGSTGQNTHEAIAAGWVVVSVGARGRDNVTADGTYYGKAPAVIVDLKAAVRYLRSNKDVFPGDTDRIVSDGTSAGGAVSTLLGASGDSDLYSAYLTELGAADASDAIFGVAAYCPITDLENADPAYEFLYGSLPANGQAVDAAVSAELAATFEDYQDSLGLTGLDGVKLTGARYQTYLLNQYLQPAATSYLAGLSSSERSTYLAANPFIKWSGGKATFSFADFLTHLAGRKKGLPAFDAFDLSAGENVEFGTASTDARHFTEYSAAKANATVDADIAGLLTLMNPMHFITAKHEGRARNWFFRLGTSDTDTSLTVSSNLAAGFATLGDTVDSIMYWDAGHGANNDPEAFLAWANKITGHPTK
ncbi:subtype B tannase [Actinoplanes sp. NPDC023936]|uniref:subtype B tannase n=1 Tax=Actinoplanes sp. NPDC023936 TaxID=3154910 RepID=UPI0034029A33